MEDGSELDLEESRRILMDDGDGMQRFRITWTQHKALFLYIFHSPFLFVGIAAGKVRPVLNSVGKGLSETDVE